MSPSGALDLSAIVQVLMRRKRFALRIMAAFLVLGLALAFLLPPTYEATAVILGPQETDLFGTVSSARRALSSFTALSLLAQTSSPSDEYAAILRSDKIHRTVVGRFDLRTVYRKRYLDDAVKSLRRNTRISLSPDGTIAVAVRDHERRRAAGLANAFVEELERFNQERRVARARALVGFLEAQIESTGAQVRLNEEQLRQFGESSHLPILTAEDRSAAEGAATLLARRAALDVRRKVLSSYLEPNSDELAQIDIEISSLNREIAKLPSVMLGGARLIRDLRVQEQLLALLKAQLEQARVKTAFNIPTVEVLDRAQPPETRARPNRKLVVAGMVLLGCVAALGGAFLADLRESGRNRS